MNRDSTQVDTLITFLKAFLTGKRVPLPEIYRSIGEALVPITETNSEQRARTLQNIRRVPKYKAFDELLKREIDPQPAALQPITMQAETTKERSYQLRPLSYYQNRPPKNERSMALSSTGAHHFSRD